MSATNSLDASSSSAARVGPPGSPVRSIVANDVVKLTASNFSGELVTVDGRPRARIRFDVAITNRLLGVELVTPTWPVPPAGVRGLLLLPLEVGVIKQPGDPDETPAGDRVVPSPDWDGAPFNVLDQTIGCKPLVAGCVRYEPYPAPLGPGEASAGRTIGFDFDPSVRSFRFRLVVAVDLRNARLAFQVNSTTDAVDANPGDGVCATAPGRDGVVCTLRAAIQEANALAGSDRIILPAGTYPITLRGNSLSPEGIESGDLNITDALSITRAGAAGTVIDCAGVGICDAPAGGIFEISAGPVLITGVSLQRSTPASVTASKGAVLIDSGAEVTFRSVIIRGHTSGTAGGAINNTGVLTLDSVTIAGNTARDPAGGIANGGTLTITNSTVSGNTSFSDGGGIISGGTLFITNSTISDNHVISRISARGSGGGLYNSGMATLNSVTVAGNTSSNLGAGGITNQGMTAVVRLINTIVAGNAAGNLGVLDPSDCSGAIASQGWNLIGSTAGCTIVGDLRGNLIGVDPLLGPLADNGGPTQTHALPSGSPAINAGNPAAAGSSPIACPVNDQRGLPRFARCDIGAYERQIP